MLMLCRDILDCVFFAGHFRLEEHAYRGAQLSSCVPND